MASNLWSWQRAQETVSPIEGLGNHVDLIIRETDLLSQSIRQRESVEHHAQVRGPNRGLIQSKTRVDPRSLKQITAIF